MLQSFVTQKVVEANHNYSKQQNSAFYQFNFLLPLSLHTDGMYHTLRIIDFQPFMPLWCPKILGRSNFVTYFFMLVRSCNTSKPNLFLMRYQFCVCGGGGGGLD